MSEHAGPDSAEALEADAGILTGAARILRTRFATGKHDGTAAGVRAAAAELHSRSIHPSRRAQSLYPGDPGYTRRVPPATVTRLHPEGPQPGDQA